MASTLYDLLPKSGDYTPSNDVLLGCFLDYVQLKKLELYPAQENAILELFEEKNVILNTPTGSGKSLVASAVHFKALAQGRRSVYTCPIKALVNEKWMALCLEFGPENVGLSTGDATVNCHAPILCCTAEILANMALREGAEAKVADVVMDEFHYYADRDRGAAWQVPLLTLPQARFLLMSATLGDTTFFEQELTRLNGRETCVISSKTRPVPLEYSYAETPLAQTLETLVSENKIPVYVVHFTQLEAAESAQDFTSINVCSKEEKSAIAAALEGFKFNSPYGPEIKRWLRHGLGLHHAGLLPKYRVLVEQLAQKGLLKVICGTDTLGVGINVPIRTVLFTRLCKFDGQKTGILSARDFHQIAGRAGRKGFDDVGWVVAQAPEHVVENLKLEEKAARDGKKVVKRKPPENNFVSWDKNTFSRLMGAPPEPLSSRFNVTHSMLMNVLSRTGDGCTAMRRIISRSHESPKAKKNHVKRAWVLFRSLLDRKIIEFPPAGEHAGHLRVNAALQDDFSLDQTLSLYLLDTIHLLDPLAPDYPLDLVTLVESILENPEIILRKQLDRLKTRKMGELKEQGMEYQQRIDELEKLEYPKPKREFIYATFNAFAEKHPWVGQDNILPKSIVREMFEEFRSFSDYIKDYELQRAEGVLLRHISRVHKVMVQTIPEAAKNEMVVEMQVFLSTMIRQIDSSLIEEWERMRNLDYRPPSDKPEARPPGAEAALKDITRDEKEFVSLIRVVLFSFLRNLQNRDYEAALSEFAIGGEPGSDCPSADSLRRSFEEYHTTHQRLCLDPEARNRRHTYVNPKPTQKPGFWLVEQVLVDPEAKNDWVVEIEVDLGASKQKGAPAIRLCRIGAVDRFQNPNPSRSSDP